MYEIDPYAEGEILLIFFFLMAAPVACGSSWARGRIGVASATYLAACSNVGSLTH